MRLTHLLACAVFGFAVVLATAPHASAQMPIQGVTGTMVPPATAEAERKAEDAAAAGAGSGLHRVATAVKSLFGIHPTDGVLDQLLPGTTVVVRTAPHGPKPADADIESAETIAARISEGSVVSVDKRRQSVVVKFGSGTTSTYVLHGATKGASASKPPSAEADRVSLSYTDKTGQKVTHEFNEV